jgi:hypothetical protein
MIPHYKAECVPHILYCACNDVVHLLPPTDGRVLDLCISTMGILLVGAHALCDYAVGALGNACRKTSIPR